ncbi:hypothetical protein M8494_26335 [Serratia ureilytica]
MIDDLIVYFLTEDYFRLVVNSAHRDKDLAWIEEHAAPYGVALTVRDDPALIAVRGRRPKERAGTLFTPEQKSAVEGMKPFFGVQAGELFIATTGYTGEAGYEIALPKDQAAGLAKIAGRGRQAGRRAGARDTLRLEAGTRTSTGKRWTKAFRRWPPTWAGPSPGSRKIAVSSAVKRWNNSAIRAPEQLVGPDHDGKRRIT